MAKKNDPSAPLTTASWPTSGESFDVSKNAVYRNATIETFLRADDRFFLVAAKGMGKTILLKMKRQQLQAKRSPGAQSSSGVIILPENSELDYVTIPQSLSVNWRTNLEDVGAWNRLWQLAIVLSLILNVENRTLSAGAGLRSSRQANLTWIGRMANARGLSPTLAQKLLARLNTDETCSDTPSQILSALLSMDVSHFKAIEAELFPEITRFYIEYIRSGVSIFIDSFDQSLAEVDVFAGRTDIWINGQIGLIKACWQINRQNPHIKIYTSMRQEAYARFQDEDRMAMEGSIVTLRYGYEDLREIFDILVRNYEEARNLRELCGIDFVSNTTSETREELFDYVYRHTLGKPREFAVIGKCLHDDGLLGTRDLRRKEENLRRIVNATSANEINQAYLAGEMPRFLETLASEETRRTFFDCVPFNILKHDDLDRITQRFVRRLDADSAPPTIRPFQELYNVGLLGVLSRTAVRGGTYQAFKRPDQYTTQETELPESDYYFLHPALDVHLPRSLTSEGKIRGVVVGDRVPWTASQTETVRANEIRVFLSYSAHDRDWVDAFEQNLLDSLDDTRVRAFVWRDIWRMRAGVWVQEQIEEALRESDVLVAVLSQRSLDSRFVESEWRTMLRRELKHRSGRLIPVSRDHINKDHLPEFLANKHVTSLDRRRPHRYAELMRGIARTIIDEVAVLRKTAP